VYTNEEDTGVETLDVACCDDVDVGEFSGWEEDVGWDVWVEDDGVCVNPPVTCSQYCVVVMIEG
jgi:hypothetical protein